VGGGGIVSLRKSISMHINHFYRENGINHKCEKISCVGVCVSEMSIESSDVKESNGLNVNGSINE
jgi:hypothetical protein